MFHSVFTYNFIFQINCVEHREAKYSFGLFPLAFLSVHRFVCVCLMCKFLIICEINSEHTSYSRSHELFGFIHRAQFL